MTGSSIYGWQGRLSTAVSPYVAGIPSRFRKGDSATWNDVPYLDQNGTLFDSGSYTLQYRLAGPAVLTLIATANGTGWTTILSTSDSGTLTDGTYWYAAQLTATGKRITIAEGELTVEPDLAAAVAGYTQQTQAEKALAAAEAALATFQASGGRVQAYTIGSRHMQFQNDAAILEIVKYWRTRVVAEKTTPINRMILARFNRVR